MTHSQDLSALIGSRICHDLISPIGAIGNGVELLQMGAGTKRPELALISESVASASARIRFLRIAFGAADGEARIARVEVQAILGEVTTGSRLRIEWTSGAELDRREVKLAFLAIQCLETAMPWGGRIAVEAGDPRYAVKGEAARLKFDPQLWEVLSNPHATVEITAALVHFALLRDTANRQSRLLTAELDATEIRLAF